MCVICISKVGVKQPTKATLKEMFDRNPDGSGFMYARDGKVHIHKGFMDFKDYYKAIKEADLTTNDATVYHSRISTQGGINPEMTHPFPWTTKIDDCLELDCIAKCGIAHNGIISMTSYKNAEYSDTAYFISGYLSKLIRKSTDILNENILDMIDRLTNSKWAIMDGDGNIGIVGKYIEEDDGLMYSNSSYKPFYSKKFSFRNGVYGCEDFYDLQ